MRLKIQETNTRLRLHGSRDTLDFLAKEFRYRPPNYWRSPAYQLYQQTKDDLDRKPEGWDGYLNLIDRTGPETAVMFRGHREKLVTTCDDFAIDVEGTWITSPFIGLTVDDIPADIIKAPFELDHDQKTCVANLLRAGVGVVKVVTSGGKTAIFSSIAAMIKQRSRKGRVLYVTPSERLVKQVTKESRQFLPGWNITQAGGGVKDFTGKDMVVATMATLHRNITQLFREGFFSSIETLLVDEVHHAPADTWSTVIRLIPAPFRFGASDTIKDEREEDICDFYAIRGFFGPKRAEITAAPLIKTGRVARPHLHLVDIPEWEKKFDDLSHVAEVDSPAWCLIEGKWYKGTYKGGAVDEDVIDEKTGEPLQLQGVHTIDIAEMGVVDVESRWCLLQRAFDVGVIRFKERNRLIVEWAKHYSAKGWPTIVIATRRLHVLILEALLKQANLDVITLTGSDSSRQRDDAFAWVLAAPGRILVTPLIKEGVSIPELKAGIVADVVASPDLARQIIGRFIRKKAEGENEAHLTWFIDRQYRSARRNCAALFKELEQIRGYTYWWPAAGPEVPGLMYSQACFE